MRLFVAACAAVLLSSLTVAPAEAATGWDRCDPGHFCVFGGLNGTGAFAQYTNGDRNLGDSDGPTGLNDNIESVWNRVSDDAFVLYGQASCEGASTIVWNEPRKGNLIPSWRNRVSSLINIRVGDC
jgi:hypothetical protein